MEFALGHFVDRWLLLGLKSFRRDEKMDLTVDSGSELVSITLSANEPLITSPSYQSSPDTLTFIHTFLFLFIDF